METEKYALLDTDFISKTHLIRKDESRKLIDKIMMMPGYIFYCHAQIKNELNYHNIIGPSQWLEDQVLKDVIHVYDDEMILSELSSIYGDLAPAFYTEMLKNACDAYKDGYFEEKFLEMSKVKNLGVDKQEFLEKLFFDCETIGAGNNLGELKSYVLLQFLNHKFGQKIYVFCSDGRNARNGIVAMGGASCISVLSAFIRLKKEIGLTRKEAELYFQSYLNNCIGKEQTTFKVQDTSKERRMQRIPCEQVFDEMFSGKIDEMQTGNLKYID